MITKTFSIDLQHNESGKSNVVVNQGNVETITFNFHIFNGLKEIDYTPFSEARVSFSKDGKLLVNSPCLIGDGKISYTVEPEALKESGLITGQLDLSNSVGNLATTYFDFTVIPSLSNMTLSEHRAYVNEVAALLAALSRMNEQASADASVISEIVTQTKEFLQSISEDNIISKEILEESGGLLEALKTGMIVKTGDVEVETLEDGEAAEVEIESIGNTLNFTFKLPKGMQGDKGESGNAIIFSAERPEGEWNLWLQDLGEVEDIFDREEYLLMEFAPLDAPGEFAVMDETGGETVLNMTDNKETAKQDDIIISEQ